MRINKYLAACGLASRRKVEEYILDGKIKVNDIVETNLGRDILETDGVCFEDQPVFLQEEIKYFMLNKPKGYVTTVKDDRGRKTVLDIVKVPQRVYPVGRLDYDSEGLLLLTNDGELTNKLTHPKHNIGKTYSVSINSSISTEEVEKLRKGIIIDGYKLHECKIKVFEIGKYKSSFEIVIFEGRNREIRKMFESINKKVVFLKRIKIGELKLGGLKRGEYRELTPKEVEYLKNL